MYRGIVNANTFDIPILDNSFTKVTLTLHPFLQFS
jgi:hypothetical protein